MPRPKTPLPPLRRILLARLRLWIILDDQPGVRMGKVPSTATILKARMGGKLWPDSVVPNDRRLDLTTENHMVIAKRLYWTIIAAALAFLPSIPATGQNVNKQCNDEWLAEKTHTTKWPDFMKECRIRIGTSTTTTIPRATSSPSNPGKSIAPAAAGQRDAGTETPKKPRAMTEHDRQIQCEAEWKADRAQLVAKTPGLVWSQFRSECDKRLKAGLAR